MAVDLIMGYRSESFTSKMEENSVEEAASAGLESVEKLIRLLSQTQQQYERSPKSAMEIDVDYKSVTDLAVNKFKKVISLLGRTRTGHARFRRGPPSLPYHTSVSPPPPPSQLTHESIHPKQENINMNISISNQCSGSRVYCPTPIQRLPPPVPSAPSHHHHQNYTNSNPIMMESSKTISFTSSPPISTTTTSFMSSLTGETESKQPSCGRPPLCTKRKCSSVDEGGPKCGGGHGRCHCSKRRKSRVKRVVRVPAISLKMSDIPPDDFSWRKYGQKPIKGSPHPRGYYKCSSMKFCPARKHVERALDDPAMLIVTYDGEHNHSKSVTDTASLILESS